MIRYAWFIVWLIGVTIPLCYAMGIHYTVLPTGPASGKPGDAGARSDRFTVTHFVAPGCPCSKLVIDNLASRGPLSEVNERVWILGDDAANARSLTARGFTVESGSPDVAMSKFGITGGPWLLIENRDGAIIYSGGYAERRPRSASELCDTDLIRRARHGETPKSFPAYGCATSMSAKRAIDPLGLKY